jgi:magnesium-transporting ATPase (P-type)
MPEAAKSETTCSLDRVWHATAAEETVHAFGSDPKRGLSDEQARERQSTYGANSLSQGPSRTALMRFAAQFNNLFIYLLLAAGTVTATLGEWLDSSVIFGVVVIIAIIGFIQEGRAERALEAVRDMLSPKAWVLRDGRRDEISAEELVPGDIVLLTPGDRVPADLRLVRARNLQIQEAILTGESTAVDKSHDPVAEDAEIGDRSSMAFSATLVTTGQGTGIVVATGDATEIGRISGMLARVESLKTPLMQRLDAFTKVLSVAIIALAALTFATGVLLWEREWGEMFFAAVSIAVAAIPEGLPAVMTVTLAIGVERMARRNAIIRRLPAVETLGSVTIICSDKTGTLTKNEMTAKTIRTEDGTFQAEGTGYEPHGGIVPDDPTVEPDRDDTLLEMIRGGMLCNDSDLRQSKDGRWVPQGDPTEAALIVLAHKAGLAPPKEHEERPRIDEIPFASERRYMATLHHDHQGNHFIYVKGAPERVLEMCPRVMQDGKAAALDIEEWHKHAEQIADHGQRVLAIARKDVGANLRELSEKEAERDLVLLGFFGLIDPPRDEAIEAVATCQSAGIRVKMITGDHALTALAVARELGLENTHEALTGRDIESIDDDDLRRKATEIDVFARASPEHKLRLVTALQAERQVTAMTGDGVNDAPALKRADIGIAMGLKGTEAAREAAQMVLADDNFASIACAVDEGRTVYDNLKKAILFILPTNAAQSGVIVAAILLGMVLPVTPVQILWVNMVTAITLGIAFAWERAEGDVMKRPPRRADEPLLTGFVLWRLGFVGLMLMLGAGLLFAYEQAQDDTSLEFARTVAVNALVMGQIFYLLNTRFFDRPAFTLDGMTGNRAVMTAIAICIALQLVFTYAPFMNILFGTAPLDAGAWMNCIGVGLAVFVLVEVEKAVRRGWSGRTYPEAVGNAEGASR